MTKFLILTEEGSTGKMIALFEPRKGETVTLVGKDENGNPFKFKGKVKEILDTIKF